MKRTRIKLNRLAVLAGTIALSLAACPAGGAEEGTHTLFDFETGDLQGWKVVEGEFGKVVADRARFHTSKKPYNKQGKFFLSTVEAENGAADDGFTGVIRSPVFVVKADFLTFLVGGGQHRDTYVALCDERGKELLKASGRNSEPMVRREWDVRAYRGRRVFMRVVDKRKGGWGHVTLDDVRMETAKVRAKRLAALEAVKKERAADEQKRTVERWKRVEKMLADKSLLDPGKQRVYRGKHLEAISFPVGGIGSGLIQINGKAELNVWQIFNNFNYARVPDTFFAVWASSQGAKAVVRALQTAPAGDFPAMKRLSFRGEYPFGWYKFEDDALPVEVQMEVFNPLIPLNARDSAIPCAIFRLTARNTSRKPVEVIFLAAQQNAAGYTGKGKIDGRLWAGYGGNSNRIVRDPSATILHMTVDKDKTSPGFGDMALAAVAKEATAMASWERSEDLLKGLVADADGGQEWKASAGPSAKGRTLNGALAIPFKLAAGESRTVAIILAWHFPNARHGWVTKGGNMYASWYGDAMAVARDVAARLDDLTSGTRKYHDTLYASNLPRWMLDRISSQLSPLRSKTCFWGRDGFFGGWEGCNPGNGCCRGNCAHVWHYAQAHACLFPSIARRMRRQALRFQAPDGSIPFRLPRGGPACDGQTGEILEAYREHLRCGDGKWLHTHWPGIRKAMAFVIKTWDPDEDGVLSGIQHNTLDCNIDGSSSWLGSMYLAALAASEKMAAVEDDKPAAVRYRRIRESGANKQNAALWNGEYYIQIPGKTPQRDYNNGCHIDQVLGVWWANQLGLDRSYPADRTRRALRSLLKYNFRDNFHGMKLRYRRFVANDDAGLLMITWPQADRPARPMHYYDEVMSGFEYAAAATMVQMGLLREGFLVVKAASDRYDGRLRTGMNKCAWGYTGNPFGDDECGKFYARPMSIWSMLLACQGFVYDGPAGVIGFRPVWRPDDHRSFFSAAAGWGLFTQKRAVGKQVAGIELRYGRLRVGKILLQVSGKNKPVRATVTVAGKPVKAKLTVEGHQAAVILDAAVTVEAGSAIHITLSSKDSA